MNLEQVKEEAKKRFNKDITDEQAKAWLDAHPAGELQDEELENVAGGGCSGGEKERFFNSDGPCRVCECKEYIIGVQVGIAGPEDPGTRYTMKYCAECGYCFGEL